MYYLKRVIFLGFICTLAACSQSGVGVPGPGGSGDVGGVEAYIMKGRVTNSRGAPLEGVEVFVDNTLAYDSNIIGVSDANGFYRIDLSGVVGSWHGGAYVTPSYEGQVYHFALEADNDNAFAGVDGAVRNFTWKISGPTPDGSGYYGGLVYLYGNYSASDFDMANVELTFTPEGPLVDGSTGQTLVRQPDETLYIHDVPIGRYTVTGRYLDPSGAVRQVLLAPDDGSGNYQASQSAVFLADALEGPMLELNVRVQ